MGKERKYIITHRSEVFIHKGKTTERSRVDLTRKHCALSLSTFGFALLDRDVSIGRILEELSISCLRWNYRSAEFKVVGS